MGADALRASDPGPPAAGGPRCHLFLSSSRSHGRGTAPPAAVRPSSAVLVCYGCSITLGLDMLLRPALSSLSVSSSGPNRFACDGVPRFLGAGLHESCGRVGAS